MVGVRCSRRSLVHLCQHSNNPFLWCVAYYLHGSDGNSHNTRHGRSHMDIPMGGEL